MGDLTLEQIDRKPLLNDVDADKEFWGVRLHPVTKWRHRSSYMNISNIDKDLLLKPNFVTSFLAQSLSLHVQSLCKNSKKETKSSQQTIPIITKLINVKLFLKYLWPNQPTEKKIVW